MESRDGDEHHRGGKGGEDVREDHGNEVPSVNNPRGGEDVNGNLSQNSSDEAADKCPEPQLHGREVGTPFSGVVSETDLEGKVDKDSKGEVFLAESLIKELKVGNGIVGLEANLGDQVDDNEGLDVWVVLVRFSVRRKVETTHA